MRKAGIDYVLISSILCIAWKCLAENPTMELYEALILVCLYSSIYIIEIYFLFK